MTDEQNVQDRERPGSIKRDDPGQVVFPLSTDQFRDFVRSLLGSPQSISRVIEGAFEVRVEDFNDLHQLLVQRIAQQNKGSLAKFSARLGFSDNSSVLLNSLQDLLTYNEIRPIVTTSAHLTWVYLVQFEDKVTPERQTIQISFHTSADYPLFLDEDSQMVVFHRPLSRRGSISFRIEHTARTWGSDIDALLSNHLRTLVKPEPVSKRIIRTHRGKVAFGLSALVFLSCLVGAFLTTRSFAAHRVAEVLKVLSENTGQEPAAIVGRLEYLAKFVAGGAWSQYYFAAVVFLFLSLFASIALAAWSETAADSSEPCFLLFSREDSKNQREVLRSLQRKWYSFIIAVVTSIATGVVSNLLFVWMFS